MKKFNQYSIVTAFAVSLIVALAGPIAVFAATTPSLGEAATYGVLSDTYTNPNVPLPTTVNGDVGFTIPPVVTPLPLPRPSGTYPNYATGGNYSLAGTAQATALTNLNSQPCTFTFVAPAVVLDTTLEHAPTYTPGVYCSTGAMSVGTAGGITLNGAGTYIFRSGGALNTVAGSTVNLAGGASACDVFWTPNGDTTLNANSSFIGTVIPVSQDITVLSATSWIGRALTFGHTVTTPDASVVISVPTCPVPSTGGGIGTQYGTINVIKTVINDNGGTKVVSNFPLLVNAATVFSGVTNIFQVNAYHISETSSAGYTRTFSGDCDATGLLILKQGENAVCVITNNDIGAPVSVPPVPPLIDVVKVPSPLALPAGPGPVKYTYTVRNIGTVPMSNITMVGDSCAPLTLISGDTNSDSKLDVNETWIYTCSTNLSATHTNTVVATGWANGLSAVDIASATVVVGAPIVPPLIHITKVPNPLALNAGGGTVTYTEKITNPGTVPLSNVHINDDKCSPLVYISGDTNVDLKLDKTETWTFICKTNLSQTTTNTATATGEANGITVKDFAIATVVVATAPVRKAVPPVHQAASAFHGSAPSLPNTGFPPVENATSIPWFLGILAPLTR